VWLKKSVLHLLNCQFPNAAQQLHELYPKRKLEHIVDSILRCKVALRFSVRLNMHTHLMSLISYSKEKANEGIQQTYDRLANEEITTPECKLTLGEGREQGEEFYKGESGSHSYNSGQRRELRYTNNSGDSPNGVCLLL